MKGVGIEELGKPDADALRKRLMDAIWNEDEERALRVLKAGADPNSKNGLGSPALCEAADAGLEGIVVELLKAGADPTARDPKRSGLSAYGVALSGGLSAYPAVEHLARGVLAWAGDDPGRLAQALLCAMSDDRPLLDDKKTGSLLAPLAARLVLAAPGEAAAQGLACAARAALLSAERCVAELDSALEAAQLRACALERPDAGKTAPRSMKAV